ncbi:MAG: hypothetical protein ACRDLB_04865 [Actinomycetota bacterium]
MRKGIPFYASLVLIALLAVALPARSKTPDAFTLAAGDDVFWNGPYIEDSDGQETFDYRVKVTEPGYRLRIGIDHPEVGDVFDVDITGPGGGGGSISPGEGLYSAEFEEIDPAPGVWRVRVTATSVTDSAFRMRAKLEKRSPNPRSGKVLPNLQVLPAHDASFLTPVTNGLHAGEPIGLDLLGAESCHPEEHVQDMAIRCLRFSYGIRNTGLGPLQLHHEGGPPRDATLYQRIVRVDGSPLEREAGIARWHATHAHFHHHDAVGLRLYRVDDTKTGASEAVTAKRFKGFAHRDELLREWRHFYPTWDRFGFGLSAGWSDIYEWDRPGNYIDFGTNGDGYYFVRMWADPVAGILESNERDNVGYTYFKVTGSEIELLEAGRGSDPWDPCKIVMPFGGYPEPRPQERPSGCPPDTT